MSRNDRKKQRHELKRREKRLTLRRADQGSPYKKIGAAGSVAACYINDNWREEGIASIQVLLRVPGGGHAVVAFLVDRWCIGLKDAIGRLDISAEEFDHHIHSAADRGVDQVAVDIGAVRRLVAGGIRWSHEHGFRLPPRYERWVAALGGIGDWHTADVSGFGVHGKLRYVGELEDLRRRLIGTSLENFLARDDVEFIGGLGPSVLDDEDDDTAEQAAELIQERALDAVRQWCFANNIIPHPRLDEAVEIMVTGILETSMAGDEPSEKEANTAGFNVERLLSLESAESESGLRAALTQLSRFMSSFRTPEELTDALGIPPLGAEELIDEEP